MNDRFKFRAKRLDNNNFVYGYLCFIYTDNKKHCRIYSTDDAMSYDCYTETLGQCTGLKDKNGKLIYEDDIVRWSLCRGDGDICENYQIIWRDNCAAFGCLKSNGDILDMFSQPELKAKVIGNVHENPDLLESEE